MAHHVLADSAKCWVSSGLFPQVRQPSYMAKKSYTEDAPPHHFQHEHAKIYTFTSYCVSVFFVFPPPSVLSLSLSLNSRFVSRLCQVFVLGFDREVFVESVSLEATGIHQLTLVLSQFGQADPVVLFEGHGREAKDIDLKARRVSCSKICLRIDKGLQDFAVIHRAKIVGRDRSAF